MWKSIAWREFSEWVTETPWKSKAWSEFSEWITAADWIQRCGGSILFQKVLITFGGAEVLWQNLKRLGIREDDGDHPAFGNVKNAADTLAKQRYIQKEKLNSSEGEGFVYELAERALDERCLAGMDNFMLSMLHRNTDTLLSWRSQPSEEGEFSHFD